MKDTDKIEIFAYYGDGSIQSWGYDGDQFATYELMFDDVAHDFAKQLVNVTKIRFMFNESDTKDLLPTIYGKELTTALIKWLAEIGVYENGN